MVYSSFNLSQTGRAVASRRLKARAILGLDVLTPMRASGYDRTALDDATLNRLAKAAASAMSTGTLVHDRYFAAKAFGLLPDPN